MEPHKTANNGEAFESRVPEETSQLPEPVNPTVVPQPKRKKSSAWRVVWYITRFVLRMALGVALAAAVLAGYVAYVLASRFEVGYSPAALLLLQVLYVVSIAVGIAALCKRRFVCGLIGIAIPLLLPLCDLIVRLATR